MKRSVSNAQTAKILFNLVESLDPRLKTLSQWFETVVQTTEKWSASEGNQGVKRMKDILSYGWNLILSEKPQTLPFVKSRQGCPDLVIPLVRRVLALKPDARLLSLVLSLVRITDLWEGIPEDAAIEKSLRIITDSSLPSTAKQEIRNFQKFLMLFAEAYPKSNVVKALRSAIHLDDSDKYLYRYSRGPNGPLIGNAHLDILSLNDAKTQSGSTLLAEVENSMDLIGSCADYSFGCNREFSCLVLSSLGTNAETIRHSVCPGKLSFKPEKGGKIRIIAQPDYFTQVALRPIHKWLERVLRAFPTDYTFNQRGALPTISKWQVTGSGYTASFDQSACTDRFPFEFQLKVLSVFKGTPVMESIRTVVADRDWFVRLPSGRTRVIRWSVGQPLGMYGSWPLMAVSHHLLVQYSYWLAHGKTFNKKGPFNRYAVCGDDIVIADKPTADVYLRVCKKLGMVVNEAKSHISGGKTNIPPVSEFTKVIVWRGTPLSPIKPKQLKKALVDARGAVPLLFDLSSSGLFRLRKKFLEVWIRKTFPREKAFLTTLITLPPEFGGLGFRDDRSIRRLVAEIKPGQVHPLLYYVAMKVRSEIKKQFIELASLESLASSVSQDIFRKHPLREFVAERQKTWHTGFQMWEKPPSVSEILYLMLVRGIRQFESYITILKREEILPGQTDNDDTYNLSIWERVLKRELFLRPKQDSTCDVEAEASHLMAADPLWLQNRQTELLLSMLLGKRLVSRQKAR